MSAITVGREDRDVLVDLMAWRWFVAGDLRIMRDREAGVPHEVSAARFGDDLRLMSDLGWLDRRCLEALGLPGSEATEFEVGLPPGRLRDALERALADARAAEAAGERPHPGSSLDLFHRAERICEALLDEIDRTEESG